MSGLILAMLLAQEPVKVATTLPVLASLAKEVGGDRVAAEPLMTPGRDPHLVGPDTELMKKAARAGIFIELGMGLDPWGQAVVNSAGNAAIQRGAPGFVTASSSCWKGELPKEISRAWGDVHPEGNPHVWLDPVNAAAMARTIAEALAKVDAAHAADYGRRADAFEARIYTALIGEACAGAIKPDHLKRLAARGKLLEFIETSESLKPKLGGWFKKAEPLRGLKVVSYHKTYFYLAHRFGLNIVAELEEVPGSPINAAHLARVVKTVKESGVRLILNDSFYRRDTADYVAAETGAKVVITHIDVGEVEGVDDTFKLMDRLLDDLLAALK